MATMKRRIIYMSDEEWQNLTARSKTLGVSISAAIRNAVSAGEPDLLMGTISGPVLSPQAQRDAILRRINKGG